MSTKLTPTQKKAFKEYNKTRKSEHLLIDEIETTLLNNKEVFEKFKKFLEELYTGINLYVENSKQTDYRDILRIDNYNSNHYGIKYDNNDYFNLKFYSSEIKILFILTALSCTSDGKVIMPFLDVPFKNREGEESKIITLQDTLFSHFCGICFGQGLGFDSAFKNITEIYINQYI